MNWFHGEWAQRRKEARWTKGVQYRNSIGIATVMSVDDAALPFRAGLPKRDRRSSRGLTQCGFEIWKMLNSQRGGRLRISLML